jgi:hypothetical protein
MKDYVFTRIWVVAAMVFVRMSPLVGMLIESRFHTVSSGMWAMAFIAAVALQLWFYWVSRRCANEQYGYTKGLFLIGACMSTGWSYLDLVFVSITVVLAQLISLLIGLLPKASENYARLVHLFYRFRMEQ